MGNYIAGTRRGEGIAFERTDEESVKLQKELIGKAIRERMDEKGLSLRKLESMTNVHFPQLQKMIKAETNYSIETLLRVMNALDIDLLKIK